MTARHNLWSMIYIQHPKVDFPQWNKVFRKQFWLPYQSFLDLLAMLRDDNHGNFFERWKEEHPDKQFGKIKASPMELLLLGSLRYLGRGWSFDDLEESTFITSEVHWVFFHKFVEFGSKMLYPMYVSVPTPLKELRDCESEYRAAGFPGCIGSTDATHIRSIYLAIRKEGRLDLCTGLDWNPTPKTPSKKPPEDVAIINNNLVHSLFSFFDNTTSWLLIATYGEETKMNS